ncbi:P-II family nitrogen regulator [Thermodesulfatator indicus]|uniref:P-II family nitrogen regulator n=1 Tax=Thermodesulfatator indicus TaxID=171695 RepID=UPI003CCB02AF
MLRSRTKTDSYTVDRVCGKGERGIRFGLEDDFADFLTNVRITILVKEELALKVAVEIEKRFFSNYAGIVYLQDAEVLRPQKFGLEP